MVEEREVLMNLRPQNDFEKLIWERHMNKILSEGKKEADRKVGMLQSELDELKYQKEVELTELKRQFKKSEKKHLIIENEALRKKNANNKEIINKHIIKIHELKRLNEDLFLRLAKLQPSLIN